MPGVPGITERPLSIRSGGSIQQPMTVQHRSDLIMEEQMLNVRDIQDALKQALEELEQSKGEFVEFHVVRARELKAHAEQMVLVLQIASKLNTELMYARSELERAIRMGANNINEIRRRVNWIEDRMERLVMKKSPRRTPRKSASPKKAQPTPQFKSAQVVPVVDTVVPPNDSGYVADYNTSTQVNEPSSLSDSDLLHLPPLKHVHYESCEEEKKQTRAKRKSSKRLERTETDLSEQQARDKTPGQLKPPAAVYQEKTETSLYPPSTEYESEDEKSSISEGTKVSSPMTSAAPTPFDKEEQKTERSESRPDSIASSHLTTITQGGESATARLTQPTFITDLAPSAMTNKSRVTIKSPEPEEEDEVARYWSSEHHRFGYGEFADVLIDQDPLSYHQVGLALPGTFLNIVDNPVELPWRSSSRSTEGYDIHDYGKFKLKMALDNLSLRINKIYQRVYEAAMLSVDPNYLSADNQGPPKLTLMSREKTPPQKPGMKQVTGVSRPPTNETLALPPLNQERLGTSDSGRMIYYPKPIPPPQHLPVSRLRRDKEYPRLSSSFANPDRERGPAERIVDQRNLYEETKFRLYRGRTKAKTPNRVEERESSAKMKRLAVMAKTVGAIKGIMDSSTTSLAEEPDKADPIKWRKLKSHSGALEHTGFKWERVKSIVHSSLVSPRDDERRDAAKHLGLLKCGDASVIYALKERLNYDEDEQVRFNATKSLAMIGCWDEEVLASIVDYLTLGNTEIRLDLIKGLCQARNVQFVNKNLESFPDLVKILSHFCRNPDPSDPVAFDAAICLGKLCVADESAKDKMRRVVEESSDTHTSYQALEVLVRQLHHRDEMVVKAVMDQLAKSSVWKYRIAAAKLLSHIGPRHVCTSKNTEKVFDLLVKRLWDDPNKEVRVEVAQAIHSLNLFHKACDRVEKRLDDPNEDTRAHAVISLGTLGVKSDKIIRVLIEMLELDSSEYVRLMVIRTFGALGLQDKRIIRALREKERGEGILARESAKILKQLVPSTPVKVHKGPRPVVKPEREDKHYTHRHLGIDHYSDLTTYMSLHLDFQRLPGF